MLKQEPASRGVGILGLQAGEEVKAHDPIPLEFTVPGQPQGKGRPRAGKTFGGHVRLYTPEKTVAYEGLVAYAAQAAMAGRALFAGPVALELSMFHQVPQSWSKKRQAMALVGEILPTVKCDADNCLKAVLDALNGVAWKDDVQVVCLSVAKRYDEVPRVVVRVDAIDAEGAQR